jgi:threonine dehydrogenase-like Zn-dependent dehydrogenase
MWMQCTPRTAEPPLATGMQPATPQLDKRWVESELRALTVKPGEPNSARLEEVPEREAAGGRVLVRMHRVGVCGTDREIIAGEYGTPPAGETRLILGHESVGRVDKAPRSSGFSAGDWVVGIVRHPDPVPCPSCAAGEWDMCTNGQYTEHGIKERHGFCVEQAALEPGFLVKVPARLGPLAVLLEPASVLAKAWEHIERIGNRAHWEPKSVLVTGAGPVGLLAALMGRQRGYQVSVFDRATSGPKPELARALGATYHHGDLAQLIAQAPPDIVLECTGAAKVLLEAVKGSAHSAVVCLLGVPPPGGELSVDVGELNRLIVLQNDAVFGSVNANRHHYEVALEALDAADPSWLEAMISRRVPLDKWHEALERRPNDVKVVIELASDGDGDSL